MRPLNRRLPPLILAYHGVADVQGRGDPFALFTPPTEFRRHLRRLRGWGYTFVTFGVLAELAAAGRANGHVALTFDDGLADNLEVALPLAAEFDAPATVFVVSSWVGGVHPETPWARIVSAEQIRVLRDAGWEIGSHTRTHADLTQRSYDEALHEWTSAKTVLDSILGTPVDVAAYPWGRVSETASRACRDAGYRAACRISGEGSWTDPYNLPRQDMGPGSSILGLRLKRDDRYESLLRRKPVRAIRRARRLMRRR